MNKRQDIIVGILLVVFAIGLMLYSLNIAFFGPDFFRLSLTAILFFIAIMNISPLSFPGLIMPLTFAFLVNASSFDLYPNKFLTIVSGILLSLGLNIIFQKKKIFRLDLEKENIYSPNGKFNIQNNFKNNRSYIRGQNLHYGYLESNFSSSEIVLDPESLSYEPMKIVLNVSFSNLSLMIPENTEIIDYSNRIFAGSKNKPEYKQEQAHKIEIHGDLNFSKFRIKYF